MSKGNTQAVKDMVRIKYIRKAHMWARTEFKDGKQTITWSAEKPKKGM